MAARVLAMLFVVWSWAPPAFTQVPSRCSDTEFSHLDYCCNKCHAGEFMRGRCVGAGDRTSCSPCNAGTFTEIPNFRSSCISCTRCETRLGQVEVSGCSATRNAVCGCPATHYKLCQESSCTTFSCSACTLCGPGFETDAKCGGTRDTACRHCSSSFYNDGTSLRCLPCARCREGVSRGCNATFDRGCYSPTPPAHRTHTTGAVTPPQNGGILVVVVVLAAVVVLVVVAVGVTLVPKKWRHHPCKWFKGTGGRRCQSSPAGSTNVSLITTELSSQPPTTPPTTPPTALLTAPPPTHLSDRCAVKYLVCELVPASRWREFVRRLGLSSGDIEDAAFANQLCPREARFAMMTAAWQRVAWEAGGSRLAGGGAGEGGGCDGLGGGADMAAMLAEAERALRDMSLDGIATQLRTAVCSCHQHHHQQNQRQGWDAC